MNIKNLIPAVLLLITLSSCTKVINVDLNSANPNMVVDAEIADQPGPYKVSLTKTVNFSDDNIFPAVSGAVIVLSDNAGNSETLAETSPGNYTSAHLQGVVGRTYNISINTNGKTYTAVSTMPAALTLDSLVADSTDKGNGFGGGSKKSGFSIRAAFSDPPGVTNYYRLVEYVNNVPNYDNIVVISDKLRDGTSIGTYVTRRDTAIHKGDTITVSLQCIDANVYEYFRTLDQITSDQGGLQTTSPGNPTSNLSNNALGFFSAYAVRSKTIVIQ